MRIYQSDLHNDTEVISGGQLLIADPRTRSISGGASNTSDASATSDGLLILSGDHTFILDGQGSQFNPKNAVNTATAIHPLNYIRTGFVANDTSVTGDPETLYLLYQSGISTAAAGNTAVTATEGIKINIADAFAMDYNETVNVLPIAAGATTTPDDFTDSSIRQDSTGHVTIVDADGSTARNLTVSGDLTVQGTTTTINTTQTVVEDRYLEINVPESDADVTHDAGFLVAYENNGGANFDPTSADRRYAGIRFNPDAAGGARWEINNGDSTTAGVGSWAPIGTSSSTGTVQKYAATHTLAANATTISIPTGTVGTPVVGTSHGLAGSDFTITVYDVATTNLLTQIIPEEIQVGTAAGGSGAELLGTVTITLPVLSTTSTTSFRIVIKS